MTNTLLLLRDSPPVHSIDIPRQPAGGILLSPASFLVYFLQFPLCQHRFLTHTEGFPPYVLWIFGNNGRDIPPCSCCSCPEKKYPDNNPARSDLLQIPTAVSDRRSGPLVPELESPPDHIWLQDVPPYQKSAFGCRSITLLFFHPDASEKNQFYPLPASSLLSFPSDT